MVNRHDPHPNEVAHAIVADVILQFIETSLTPTGMRSGRQE
jgi:hypothetical protein